MALPKVHVLKRILLVHERCYECPRGRAQAIFRALLILLLILVGGCSTNRRGGHDLAVAAAADHSAPPGPASPTDPLPPLIDVSPPLIDVPPPLIDVTPPLIDVTPPREPGPYIVFFDWDRDDISAQAAAILDDAARAYRETGIIRVTFADSTYRQAYDRALAARRAEAVRYYLSLRAVPITVRTASGEWLQIVEPAPSPRPPQHPAHARPPRASWSAARIRLHRPALGDGDAAQPPAQLGAVRSWLTLTGTITRRATEALIQECVRLEGRITADCQSAVRAGEGGFRSVPAEARSEFSFLLNSCLGARPEDDCAQIVALNREFRELPRGRLEPRPLTMVEGERSLFTARIVDDPRIQGRPGVPIDGASDPGADPARADASQSVIPFSRRMCFSLTAVNPEDFRIEPISPHCMGVRDGGGAVKYDPQWYVTPLRSGRRELLLVTELYVNNVKRDFRHQPYPLPILVTPSPSPTVWDQVDASIRRATGTVSLAVGLAEAIGSLLVAIAGWVIWSWLRRSRRKRAKAAAAAGSGAASGG